MTDGPAAIGVVIPARDEADRVDRCLAAVTASMRDLRDRPGGSLPIRVVVVLDGCRDGTADRVAAWPVASPVPSTAGQVGAARSAGVGALLALLGPPAAPLDRIWIANTDADSEVPPDWLATHVAAAGSGAAMLLGTVRPNPTELERSAEHRWYRRHRLTDGHHHVHGANLGVRADWYRRAGGFPAVPRDEDVALAAAVQAAGGRIERTGSSPVLTSGRLAGRAPGGMADYLRRLRFETDGAPAASRTGDYRGDAVPSGRYPVG